jgi:hypothetical protein
MTHRSPPYRLGPDFYGRLDTFVDTLVRDGFEFFAKEFRDLDAYIAWARAEARPDQKLRRTPREKYLLEAVAFKVYDELNREAFNRRRDTLIVMPDCFSLHNPDCTKTDEKWGDRCMECVPECQAYQTSEIGRKYGVDCVFSKRKLAEQIEHYAEQSGDLAVIGIGCLMMLASGMRTAAEVGVPARGVLLNFSGCEHWNDQPLASEASLERLEAILEEKYGTDDQAPDD